MGCGGRPRLRSLTDRRPDRRSDGRRGGRAGAYQFSRFKDVCLRVCRSPLDFLALRWGRRSLRLGVEHGLYCFGCCWALMAVLVVAATMNLAVAAAIAAIVCAEKALPGGRWTSRVTGSGLVVAALVMLTD
ncbi:MAG: DUF2182 domain-containing protein [Actinobacteria bacterium]|nr:MAG: DUF2182 domain-containing protein [Actinomycetota bacterium]